MKYIIATVAVLSLILGGILIFGGNEKQGAVPTLSPEEMRGVHIMPDGRVMSGSGMLIEGATIESDGRVRMPSGMLIVPSQDFRRAP